MFESKADFNFHDSIWLTHQKSDWKIQSQRGGLFSESMTRAVDVLLASATNSINTLAVILGRNR
jgi:hypothetical protein